MNFKPIKRGSDCYFMRQNHIHKGKVKAEYPIDSISTKYLVETSTGMSWMLDRQLFRDINELIADLKSCVIA